MSGFVYIISAQRLGLIKIGRSSQRDKEERLRQLQRAPPVPLRLAYKRKQR